MDMREVKSWLQSRNIPNSISKVRPQVVCTRTKLKKGSLDAVRKWFQTLYDRKDELLAFTEEGISLESVFLEKSGDDDFLLFYARSDDFEKTYKAILKALLPITVYHYSCWKSCCEDDSETLEVLFDLERTSFFHSP